MAIFSVRNYVLEDADVELPLDVEVIEKDDVEYASEVPAENEDPLAVTGEVGAQMESNWNEVMMAIGMHELKYMQENGHEIIYEGVDIKAFKNKVVKFFETLKKKIHSVVLNFVATLKSRCLKGEKFVAKYESEIKNGFAKLKEKKSDKRIKIYENTGFRLDSWSPEKAWKNTDGETYLKFIKNAKADVGTFRVPDVIDSDKVRAAVLDGGRRDSIPAEDFNSEVMRYFLGSDEKKEVTIASIPNIAPYIEVVKKGKSIKDVQKAWKEFQKPINDAIKSAQSIKEYNVKDDKDQKNSDFVNQNSMSVLKTSIQNVKTCLSIINQAFGGYMSAVKIRFSQARSICMACVYGNNKVDEKLFGESAGSTEDFLSNVQFV